MSENDFYFSFEAKYRGSRELIKNRQKVYLPFVEKLKEIYTDCSAFDIGCGRGEWLELMKENDILASGVDLDDDMVSACIENGFNVKKQDALEGLKSLPDESICVITGFHIAEHIPFHILQEVVFEAKRVLKPAGLLILETPNPENLMVGSCNFYMDPTHIHPLPPNLLSFLPEFTGFSRTKILRLQENPKLYEADVLSLESVLTGVSPDYSIVAQKTAEDDILFLFNELFNKKFGLTLQHLSNTYDKRFQSLFGEIENLNNSKKNSTYIPGTNMLSEITPGVLSEGFYKEENWGRWSKSSCSFTFYGNQIKIIENNAKLYFRAHVFGKPRKVMLLFNDAQLVEIEMTTEEKSYEISLPIEKISCTENKIAFLGDGKFYSPKDIGLSEDDRNLFIGFSEISIKNPIFDISRSQSEYLLKMDAKLHVDDDRFAKIEALFSSQAELLSSLQRENDDLRKLIIFTKNHTLWGFCARCWHKIGKLFRRK